MPLTTIVSDDVAYEHRGRDSTLTVTGRAVRGGRRVAAQRVIAVDALAGCELGRAALIAHAEQEIAMEITDEQRWLQRWREGYRTPRRAE